MAVKIGTLLGRYFEARAERLAAEKAVEALRRKEADWSEKLRTAMNAEKTDKASSDAGTVSLKTVDVAKVEDWDSFYSFVHKHKAAHLLYRRVNDGNVRELLEHDGRLAKRGIPGLAWEKVQKMTATAARG